MANYNVVVNGKTSNHSTDKKVEELLVQADNVKDTLIKTVSKTKTINWDGDGGDTTGKTFVNGMNGQIYVKVADYIPNEVVLECNTTGQMGSGSLSNSPRFGDNYWVINGINVEVVGVLAPTIVNTDILGVEEQPVEFSEAGLYFSYWNKLDPMSGYHENYITDLAYTAEVEQFNPDLLPKADSIPDVSAAPTAEDFNALLASLRDAGYMN